VARSVILAAVTSGIAHVFDFGFVQMRQFVLFGLGTKAQFVDVVNNFAQVMRQLPLTTIE